MIERSTAGGLPPAVVIGLDSVTGLQATRTLARNGVRVVGVVSRRNHPCARTRYASEIVTAPASGAGLVGALRSLAERIGERCVLLPCHDLAVLAISDAREELAGSFLLTLPSRESLETLVDKARFAEHAARVGLPIPATTVYRRVEDLDPDAAWEFPVVVKPAVKSAAWLAATPEKAVRAGSFAELRSILHRVDGLADEILVQEEIRGGEERLVTCNMLVGDDADPSLTLVTRKVRQWPPGFGTACLAEPARDDELEQLTRRVFESASFRGLGYVEAKHDPRTGGLRIIEVNAGRLTGRASMAEAAGVPLTMAAYAQAAGLSSPPSSPAYGRGRRWIFLRRDLLAAGRQIREGELSLGGWLGSLRGVRDEAMLDRRDPMPFVADLAASAGKLFRRRPDSRTTDP